MQFNQHISFLDKPPFFVSGPPHSQQFYLQQPPSQQHNNYLPPFSSYPNPDVIVGEGEVTSVIQPDGSVQFFFRPTNRWTQWNSHFGTYFVTSVNYPPQCYPPTYPQDNAHLLPLSSPLGQLIKFHNDQCTSTVDLEYYFPRLRSTDITVTPKSCAGVQFNSPACKNVVFTGKISLRDINTSSCSSTSDMSIDCDNPSTMSSSKTCCGTCTCSRKASDSSTCTKRTSLKISSSCSITSLDERAKKCLLKLKERKRKELEKQQKLEEKKKDKEFKQRQKELEKHRQRCKKLKQKEIERQKELERLKREYERKLAEAGSSNKCSKKCINSLDSCDSSELVDSGDSHTKSGSTCCSSASLNEPECVKTLLSKPCEQMKGRPCAISSPQQARPQSCKASGTHTPTRCPPQKEEKKCCNVENCPKLK